MLPGRDSSLAAGVAVKAVQRVALEVEATGVVAVEEDEKRAVC